MSAVYYNYFLMCYTKEPPTVTAEQLAVYRDRGLITQQEYDQIVATDAE